MVKNDSRRQVSLRREVWQAASDLRDQLAEKSGRKVTITDTIERALHCLEDVHNRGAWLSPREAAPVMEDRHRRVIVSVVAQLIGRVVPSKRLNKITFSPSTDMLVVHLEGIGEVPLFVDTLQEVRR